MYVVSKINAKKIQVKLGATGKFILNNPRSKQLKYQSRPEVIITPGMAFKERIKLSSTPKITNASNTQREIRNAKLN